MISQQETNQKVHTFGYCEISHSYLLSAAASFFTGCFTLPAPFSPFIIRQEIPHRTGISIKSTCNDLQFLLIGTTAEGLLASLPCRIMCGKCHFSGGWLLPVANPAVVLELQNCVPWGAASAVGHWLWCWAAWSWDSASPWLQCYSCLLSAVQQHAPRNWTQGEIMSLKTATDVFHFERDRGDILVFFSPSSL